MNNATVRLFGNIGRIETSYTPQGKLITKSTLAVNHGYGESKTTDWYNLTAWGGNDDKKGSADWMSELCQKGTQVYIEGKLMLRKWNDKGGVEHLSPDVTVGEFRVISRGKPKGESSDNPYDAELSDLPDPQD